MLAGIGTLRLYTLCLSSLVIAGVCIAFYFGNAHEFDEEVDTTAKVTTEASNSDMAQIISNTLSTEIDALMSDASGNSTPEDWTAFASATAYKTFDDAARKLTLDTRIMKIKVYSRPGTTVYSTDIKQLGNDYSKREEFIHALRGQPTSVILQRDFFLSFTNEIRDATIVASYLPLKGASGEIAGVIEVYSNRTTEFNQFTKSLERHHVLAALAISMLAIFILSILFYFALSPKAD